MAHKEILKQVEEYFKMELHNVKLVATRNTWAREQGRTSATINAALSRCLGVALFVQQLDIDYEDIAPLYDKYKELIEEELA